MTKFIFYGRLPSQIKNGNLHIPDSLRSFYKCDRDYVLKKGILDKFRFLAIHPIEEVPTVQEVGTTNDLSEPLEKLVVNGFTRGLKLHGEFREHLAVGKEADILLVGYGNLFDVWKPKDFEECQSSMSNEKIRTVLFEADIK